MSHGKTAAPARAALLASLASLACAPAPSPSSPSAGDPGSLRASDPANEGEMPTAASGAAPRAGSSAPGASVAASPVAVGTAPCPPPEPPAPLAWTADAGATLGAALPLRLGAPRVEQTAHGAALCFDGADDGLVFEHNPLAGMSRFTVQVLFRPDATGSAAAPSEQRFVHFEEGSATTTDSRRALLETRVIGDQWFLDTYLRAAGGNKALIDPAKKHPVGHWYWVALSYGDGTMRHYIDARLELEGSVPFEPLCPGRTSLGVRLNQVSWFKGCLRELRITPSVLPAGELQKMR